ncbi:MAG: restriction endonuclease subunit S [Clostridia bacterium]|nr:restriction endonuclease subunit S [Clostridia bacterium]
MEFETYSLGELYDVASGLSKSAKEFGNGGTPFVSFKTVFNNYFLPDEIKDVANATEKEQEKCSVRMGDVFLTRTSETMHELGMSSVALKDYPTATFNGFTKRLRMKSDCQVKVYPRYIGYYLRSREFRNQIDAMALLSTRASLNNEMIGRLTIRVPDYEIQKKIAAVLGSLDDKIELNNAINKNLEAQAKTIFEKELCLFDDVPEGWVKSNLIGIADYLNGLAMQKYRPKEGEQGLPVLKIKELRQGICDANSEFCSPSIMPKYIVEDGDVVFSWSGSLLVDFWCGGKCGLNQHLFKVTSAKFEKWFYYAWTNYHLEKFAAIAADMATTMGHIKRGELEKAEVLIPTTEEYHRIGSLLAPIYDLVISNRVENRKLAELRDSLLPKLMSGEIEL